MTLADTLKLGEEKGLDVVEMAPEANPPVAKLMDYGRFKYEQEKKERLARKKQKQTALKEVKMGIKIGKHDFDYKRDHGIDFLRAGHKLKVTVVFRGREMSRTALGRDLIQKMLEELSVAGKVETPPRQEGRHLSAIMAPK